MKTLLIFILLICLLTFGVIYLEIQSKNIVSIGNCENLKMSGYNTELRHINYFNIDMLDCYVEVESKYVPYDRFIKIEGSG